MTFDPVSQSLLVKAKGGYAANLWRKGHAAMMEEADGRYGAPVVWAHGAGRREIARGEPVRGGWLRFQLSDADYRKLVNTPDLSAIVTVDREAGRILGVKFRGRQLGPELSWPVLLRRIPRRPPTGSVSSVRQEA
jgi:hypothetical protein